MVYRIYAEKKKELAQEAAALLSEIQGFLGIPAATEVRILNRYDVEHITPERFEEAVRTVFSEPQVDNVYTDLPEFDGAVFAVEPLPGQFDQRSDSAEQCIQLMSGGERPLVRAAKVYLLAGDLTEEEIAAVQKHVVNPVESRLASLDKPETLVMRYEIPTEVDSVAGFTAWSDDALEAFRKEKGLAMDFDDIVCCRDYFKNEEQRDPTITEIRVLDTYWSDHCRHTTFLTTLDRVTFADPLLQQAYEEYLLARASIGRTKPVNLMDIGTIAAKVLKDRGMLPNLDESEEINACTVKITVDVDGEEQPWLLLFKNETHNHPTEIEPFGGAATCIGGAIRDPLSGRSYVYAAMRVTGAADPTRPLSETMEGKLPQKKIVTTAAAGYSSYGNQIGLATGQVDELYHPGYAAKRMEIGAVVGAAPAENVRREVPAPTDVVLLLGGRTGRDGCGGATGSSKKHTLSSLETCGAEVQKGNAPEERKLQRLFRNAEASKLIKRCNDFGAGGVSVAIGELAEGLEIDLNRVPRKYDGLDGTELAISESQERMAVVVAAADADRFMALAQEENLEVTPVAVVTEAKRLVMHWNGKDIVNLSRAFLDTNGAEKHITAEAAPAKKPEQAIPTDFAEGFASLMSDLNVCSKRGLVERFDSTIGAGTVLMPFGGKLQLTPSQAMVHKLPVLEGETDTCSFMAWGGNPYILEQSPYHGAYLAVVESCAKLIATGADFNDVYLSFQEYFERLGSDPKRWGKPLAALLGAFKAQLGLGVAAIGGKDSMSGSFEDLDVPPTLVSFAVTTGRTVDVLPNVFALPGDEVVLLAPEYDENGLPTTGSLLELFDQVNAMIRSQDAVAVWTPGYGGVAEAVFKMGLGSGMGFNFYQDVDLETIFGWKYGAFVVELAPGSEAPEGAIPLGVVSGQPDILRGSERVPDSAWIGYETKLESVYPCNIPQDQGEIEAFLYEDGMKAAPVVKTAKPKVLIPVFPGTNCEYDSARAFREAGAEPEIFVVRNLTSDDIARSAERFVKAADASQMIFLPGGFSGGDEPDGSGKFITAFFRGGAVKDAVTRLLDERGGLMAGICNGFQALIKLGLVPYGKILDTDETMPTLTYNTIARHQSRIVYTRVCSDLSPWLQHATLDGVYAVPISHGEGRFLADPALIAELAKNGQIATQYVDFWENPTADIRFNPNNSVCAVEGITSPDGRVFGKMGHAERIGTDLYRNVPGCFDLGMFASAVEFFD